MQTETAQRRVIRSVLSAAERPLTPIDILTRAQAEVKRLGIATVYRTLKRLDEEGLIETVRVGDSPPHYELTGKGHHHHFKCRVCEIILDVDDCPVDKKELKKLAKHLKAKIDRHDITLIGVCERCA